MLVLTAYTSLLFVLPAAFLKCGVASLLFAMLVPVSFAVHAFGGADWAVKETRAGRGLVLLDKVLAQAAAAAVIYRVATSDFVAWTVPFFLCVASVFLMYYVFYPEPPRCWVAHHAAFHFVVVLGCLFAYKCGA